MALDVQFWYTTAAKLEGLAVKDGQIIALSDGTGYFYDMGGRRYRTNNLEYVATLPDPKTLAQLKAAVENNNQTDNNAVLDLLYITPDGIFRYNGATTETAAAFDSLLPVDVKEAPDDGYVYSRQRAQGELGSWTRLRWVFASVDTIPVADLNARIAALLTFASASIKIAGTVNMTETLKANITAANKSLYIDLKDAAFTGTGTIDLDCVYSSEIYVEGYIGKTVEISGAGTITIQDAKLVANVTATGFEGVLKCINCTAANRTISYTHKGAGFAVGGCIVSGCNFESCTIAVPAESLCKNMIQGNILVSTTVTVGGTTVDALYNNVG